MINNAESKKLYKVQSGVTEYPIGFPFQCNSDGVPQLAVTIGTTYLQLNYNCKLSEDNGTLILIPTEEEAETLTGPEDYSWMDKWVDAPLVITRDIPFVQESDYQVGRISPEQIEKDFDLSVMRDQILLDKIGEHTIDISDVNAELATKATKAELDNYKLAANAAIDANATAIQKTREDYISADSEIHKILNSHTSELTALRGNQASLGVQVSNIEHKIPESASGSNPLITKQQLLDEERDIRKDLNGGLSELQTQVTAQATVIAGKQEKLIAGDNIVIGSDGKTISATGAGGGAGLSFIVYDTLPETGESGIIYLVPKDGEAPDVYDEYVWITATSTFELIGSTQVDLSDYATKENLSNYLPLSGGTLTGPLVINLGETTGQYSNETILTFTLKRPSGETKTLVVKQTSVGLDFGGAYFSQVGDIIPATYSNTLGSYLNVWGKIHVKKINNGADIAVPTEGGTLARLEDLENIDALPDQTDNAGKFLTTDGTTASWSDKPLVNNSTDSSGGLAIGKNSKAGSGMVAIGDRASADNTGVAIGNWAQTVGIRGVAIGFSATVNANRAIQLGHGTNGDANTFKVGNANGNFEMMSADGTIPAERMSATAGTTGQVLTKTDAGMEWQEASGGTTITLKEYDE